MLSVALLGATVHAMVASREPLAPFFGNGRCWDLAIPQKLIRVTLMRPIHGNL